MRKLLILLLLLWPGVSWADDPSIAPLPGTGQVGFIATVTDSSPVGFYTLGRTWATSILNFEAGSGLVGNLFVCQGPAAQFSADTCDLKTTLSIDIDLLDINTARLYYVLEITTPEGAGTSARITIRGSNATVFSDGAGASSSTSREVFAATFDGGVTATTTDGVNFVQLELAATEYVDSLADIGVSSDGNLICNTSADTIANVEVHIAAHMQQISTQARNFVVRMATCTGCIGTAFPQLTNSDTLALNVTASFTNNLDAVPIPIAGAIVALNPTQCLGLMVFGDSGRQVQIVAGGMMMAGADPTGVELASVRIAVEERIEAARLILVANFDGGAASVLATNTAWAQLPLGLDKTQSTGTGLTVSADGNLICNTSGVLIHGGFVALMNISQDVGGVTKTLLMRLGARVGEGALVDGDEVAIVKAQVDFAGAGMAPHQFGMLGYGRQGVGICVGIMVRSAQGIPFRNYTVEAGAVKIEFEKELNP